MSPLKPTTSARIAPLMVTILLCLGGFLYTQQLAQPTSGSEAPAAASTGRSTHITAAQPVDGLTSAGNHLLAFLEEVEAEDGQPVNAEYLTSLLAAVYFGCILGLLFGGRNWSRNGALLLAGRRLTSLVPRPPRVPTAPLLSVFRL